MSEISALLGAVVVPLVLAWFYRLPRRTMRLAKEVEILASLEPGSESHSKLSEHIDRLVEREIEENETTLQMYDIYGFVGALGYGAGLVVVGPTIGGFGWLMFTAGLALCSVLLLLLLSSLWKRFVRRQAV